MSIWAFPYPSAPLATLLYILQIVDLYHIFSSGFQMKGFFLCLTFS